MIGDFGLARFRDAEGGLTLPASALGSPNYMAPEQAQGIPGAIGPRTDVYGLGAILYELLTGEPPVAAADLRETLRRVAAQPPRPCHELAPGVPLGLEAIALRCLAKDANARPASAAVLAQELEAWISNPDAPVTAPTTKRPWWRLFV
jgi:serine/threonine protein kinase